MQRVIFTDMHDWKEVPLSLFDFDYQFCARQDMETLQVYVVMETDAQVCACLDKCNALGVEAISAPYESVGE